MFDRLLDLLMQCKHVRTTFPLTPGVVKGRRLEPGRNHATYVTCLDCGKEFEYDWKNMKMGSVIESSAAPTKVQDCSIETTNC